MGLPSSSPGSSFVAYLVSHHISVGYRERRFGFNKKHQRTEDVALSHSLGVDVRESDEEGRKVGGGGTLPAGSLRVRRGWGGQGATRLPTRAVFSFSRSLALSLAFSLSLSRSLSRSLSLSLSLPLSLPPSPSLSARQYGEGGGAAGKEGETTPLKCV